MILEQCPNLRALARSFDRVTPIFRKTDTIMLGADAFSRAEDIEQALYHELPRFIEQTEALRRALQVIAGQTYPAKFLGVDAKGVSIYGGSDDASRFAREVLAQYQGKE